MENKINFIGYKNYPSQKLYKLFNSFFMDEEKTAFFMVAITEAVCNAFRYNKLPYDKASVNINIKYTNKILIVSIVSSTNKKDAKEIKTNLLNLIENTDVCWHEIIKNQPCGRGLWLMLEASNRVILEPDMQKVHLVVYFPYKIRKWSNKELLDKLDIGIGI